MTVLRIQPSIPRTLDSPGTTGSYIVKSGYQANWKTLVSVSATYL